MQIGRPHPASNADCRAGTVCGRAAGAMPVASHRGPPILSH